MSAQSLVCVENVNSDSFIRITKFTSQQCMNGLGVENRYYVLRVVPDKVLRAVFVLPVGSDSIALLPPRLCFFSWKCVQRIEGLSLSYRFCFWVCNFFVKGYLFILFFCIIVKQLKCGFHVVLLSTCSCVVHCSSVFNRVIDKLVYFS